jgi:hypothetical protein
MRDSGMKTFVQGKFTGVKVRFIGSAGVLMEGHWHQTTRRINFFLWKRE